MLNWRKCVAMAAVGAMLAVPAMAEVDLSGLSLAELVELRQKVTMAMWETEEWQKVEVPVGVYEIGKDIPAGYWTITPIDREVARLTWGRELEEGRTGVVSKSRIIYAQIVSKTSPSWDINPIESVSWELTEGTYLEIGNAPVIFTPFSGYDLGFN